MRFVVGWDLEDFMVYRTRVVGTEGEVERNWVEKNPSHLIVWLDNNQIIGHAIWHESSSREHSPGDTRDDEDRMNLEDVLGGEKAFVELHELWLTEGHRRKGYGHQFFDFFEEFIKSEGFNTIIFYAYNPAAIAICRKREYKESDTLILPGIDENLEEMLIFCKNI